MTNTKEKDLNEKGLIALTNDLTAILINSKKSNIVEKTSLLLAKTIEHFKKYNDILIFKKVFFYRIDKTYLYNRLSFQKYFDAFDICFQYNVKKDILKVYGKDNLEKIDMSLKTFLEKEKLEKEKEKACLSYEEKLKMTFESKIKNFSKDELELFKTFLKNN